MAHGDFPRRSLCNGNTEVERKHAFAGNHDYRHRSGARAILAAPNWRTPPEKIPYCYDCGLAVVCVDDRWGEGITTRQPGWD